MAKVKSIYICQECGYESAKWLGKCPECNSWNTLKEETVETIKNGQGLKASYGDTVDGNRLRTGPK